MSERKRTKDEILLELRRTERKLWATETKLSNKEYAFKSQLKRCQDRIKTLTESNWMLTRELVERGKQIDEKDAIFNWILASGQTVDNSNI